MTLQRTPSRRLGRDTSARLRTAVRVLVERDQLVPGAQAALAAYYGVTRQRVHQIVVEVRAALAKAN